VAELNVALVGLGRFGRLHAETLRSLPGCRIAAVCDAEPALVERCGEQWGVAARYRELGALLADADVDAVDIVTGEAAHGEQARLALEAGCAVFVEKPLATRLDEAEAVGRLAEQTGLPVCVGNISRFDPRYAFLRRECEAGSFGRVVLVSAQRTFSRAWFSGFGSRVHPVFESMVHDLDLAVWYLPAPVRRVYAQSAVSGAAESDVPDVLAATLTAADGSLAVLQSTWLAPDAAPINLPGPPAAPLDLWGTIDGRLDLVGTAQIGRVNVLGDGLSVWGDSHHRAPDVSLWPEVHGRVTGALREELAHWLECVRSGTPSPVVPLEDGVTAVRLAEAIVRSAERGAPVEVAAAVRA
jgi:predicted dehydrogenase